MHKEAMMEWKRTRRWWLRALSGAAGLAFAAGLRSDQFAVAPPRVSAAPARQPVTPLDDPAAVQAAIQSTLDIYGEARQSLNLALLQTVADPRNAAFGPRFAAEMQDWERVAAQDRLGPATFSVTKVRPGKLGFVKADIQMRNAAYRDAVAFTTEGVWLFRQVEDRWLLAEPTIEELGLTKQRDGERLAVTYYEWDDDTIDTVAPLLEAGAAEASERVGFNLGKPTPLKLLPTLETNTDIPYALNITLSRTGMVMRTPDSYSFRLAFLGLRESFIAGRVRSTYPLALLDGRVGSKPQKNWLRIGLAQWVDNVGIKVTLRQAFQDNFITGDIIDWADARVTGRVASRRESDVALGVAGHAVRYIVEARGGIEKYWSLVDQYAASNNWERSVQQVMGQPWAAFQADYRAWLLAWSQS